jgi:hypothetical protein
MTAHTEPKKGPFTRSIDGTYVAHIDGRKLELIGCRARGGWRSWIVMLDDVHKGSYPRFWQAYNAAFEYLRALDTDAGRAALRGES